MDKSRTFESFFQMVENEIKINCEITINWNQFSHQTNGDNHEKWQSMDSLLTICTQRWVVWLPMQMKYKTITISDIIWFG
jgi:hypothetical protein